MRLLPNHLILAAALLAGCSGKGEAPAVPGAKKGAASPAAKVDCPSKFNFPERPANAPVDDVLGIRQGAKLSDAMLFLKCRPGSHVVFREEGTGIVRNTYGQKFAQSVHASDGVPRTKPFDYAKAIRGGDYNFNQNGGSPEFEFVSERVEFWSLGLAGEEIVWGIARQQIFKPGEQPAIAQLTEQLAQKYGKATGTAEDSRAYGSAQLRWVYDAFGRPVSESQACARPGHGTININGLNIYGECGLTIQVDIDKAPGNPLLAASISVGVVDQGKFVAAIKEFEQTLAGVQSRRNRDEAAKAAQAKPAAKF